MIDAKRLLTLSVVPQAIKTEAAATDAQRATRSLTFEAREYSDIIGAL